MKRNKWLTVFTGISILIIATSIVNILEPQPVEHEEKVPLPPPVTVVEVAPQHYTAKLNLLATTSSRWSTPLRASSNAQLAWLNPDIEPGTLVTKGTILARLDTSALKTQLAQSESDLKQAELNLHQQRHEQTVALKMLSQQQTSAFARREPQVAVAKSELIRAKQSLASSQQLLKESEITAPFDAVVLTRSINPGEWLSAGQVLFELASSDSLDIHLPVSTLHWRFMQPLETLGAISVLDRQGHRWPAQIRYISPQVDTNTRQRQIVLFVKQPYEGQRQLLANQQVTVEIELQEQSDIFKLPLSAVTRDNYVWAVSKNQTLKKVYVDIVEQRGELVYVRSEQSAHLRQVVAYPLLSMLPGKHITPRLEEH